MKTKPRSTPQPPAVAITLFALLLATGMSRADTVYVSNWNNDTIEKYDSVTGQDLGTFANVRFPRGIALDSAGNLYVAVFSSRSIMKYTPAGVGSVFATGLPNPESLAFDAAGNLYVGDVGGNYIMKFTPGGVGSVFAGANLPYGLAFDRAGNLYATDFHGGQITKFTPGAVSSVFATGLRGPFGITFDTAGNLFVANYYGPYAHLPAIQKLTPEGVGSVFATGAGLVSYPAGLAFDSEGNLFVADEWGGPASGRIEKFTPDGVGSIFADPYNAGPISIAIQAVPEPSPMVLLGLGLPALWVFLRHRRLRE